MGQKGPGWTPAKEAYPQRTQVNLSTQPRNCTNNEGSHMAPVHQGATRVGDTGAKYKEKP